MATGDELYRRLRALPGFGDEKARIFVALLGKRMGVTPAGWRAAAGPSAPLTLRSVAVGGAIGASGRDSSAPTVDVIGTAATTAAARPAATTTTSNGDCAGSRKARTKRPLPSATVLRCGRPFFCADTRAPAICVGT